MAARKTGQILVLVICLGVILVLAILFRSFLWTNVLRPIVIVFWLIWRVIVSVDQKFYWGVVIAATLFLVIRLLPKDLPLIQEDQEADRLNNSQGFFSWHEAFTSACSNLYQLEHLRQRIKNLYVSVVHRTDRIALNDVEELIESGQLPVSEASQSFLFPETGKRKPFTSKLKIRGALFLASMGIHRGAKLPEVAHESIDEILTLMEDKAEINHEQ